MLDALARFIVRSRRAILVGTVVLFAVAGALGGPLPGLLDSDDDFEDPDSPAIVARDLLERAGGRSASPDLVALVRLGAPIDSPQARAKIARVAERLRDRDVAQVLAYRDGPPALVTKDRRSTYLLATFRAGADDDAVADRLEARVAAEPGVELGGPAIAQEQVSTQVQEDLASAELLAFPILFALSLVVFRSAVAALLPLVVGMITILTTFLLMRIANGVEPMSVFAINLITGLGLGLAIDYSLFVVSRFREELARGLEPGEALRATMRSAGRTVAFSAVTVAAALAALIVFPQRFLFSMGVGGMLVALTAAVVSLTVLPALLVALGPRVNALGLRRWQASLNREAGEVRGGAWYRHSQRVMRRPGPIAAGTAVLLIALGLPFLRIEFTGVDATVLPTKHSARVVEDALRTEFPQNASAPVYVAVRAPASDRVAVETYARRLAELPGAAAVPPVAAPRNGLWRIDVVPKGAQLSDSAKDLVRDVRAAPAPFAVLVGGDTAQFLDQRSSLGNSLPIALAVLATTTLVILFVMTGSVVLPVKALLMNLLTLSAAFGLLVLIFQDGRLEALLAYDGQGALELTQPILLFAVAFGLSTDYGVFLLTRIKEARDGGLDDREAVAVGLERTGRIVTFAALLFCIAIGAFATSQIVFIKELGVGTALAVLIDAFLVRALLVPSLMALLGRWNWWAPRPLARLHARIGLSESE
jgi:putative drug exporter of the RND superfamily